MKFASDLFELAVLSQIDEFSSHYNKLLENYSGSDSKLKKQIVQILEQSTFDQKLYAKALNRYAHKTARGKNYSKDDTPINAKKKNIDLKDLTPLKKKVKPSDTSDE
ncbi:MAG: hypothetical protein H6607_05480 [Flavobacteriales bacterium]|nr:hypothetical protein [Flavobacteriales bacterium]